MAMNRRENRLNTVNIGRLSNTESSDRKEKIGFLL
jgi:hypothetical protein